MRAQEFLHEAPLPPDWDEKAMAPSTTFKSRLEYALQRAQRIGAGSSRVALIIEYQGRPTVLKVAKNRKGLAQNDAEISILNDGWVRNSGVAIPLIDFGDGEMGQSTWLQTELAQKATEKQLTAYFGAPITTLYHYALKLSSRGGLSWGSLDTQLAQLRTTQTPEQEERFEDYASAMATLKNDFEVEIEEFTRVQNWGFYQGHPAFLDLGFTTTVYQAHYR